MGGDQLDHGLNESVLHNHRALADFAFWLNAEAIRGETSFQSLHSYIHTSIDTQTWLTEVAFCSFSLKISKKGNPTFFLE